MPGRPRNPGAGGAILAAALTVLQQRGYDGMTLEEVARTAGVGKSSLYCRFSGKADLAAAAVASLQRELPPSTGDVRFDLISCLRAAHRNLGRVGAGIVGSLGGRTDAGGALQRDPLIAPLAGQIRRVLERAGVAGQLSPAQDVEAMTDLLLGAFFSRALMGEASASPWPERAVDAVLGTQGSAKGWRATP